MKQLFAVIAVLCLSLFVACAEGEAEGPPATVDASVNNTIDSGGGGGFPDADPNPADARPVPDARQGFPDAQPAADGGGLGGMCAIPCTATECCTLIGLCAPDPNPLCI